jgi:hypothetical protein
MRTLKTLGSAVLVTLVLVMGVDYAASAATGHPFILGKVNKADKVTVVKRTTAGPALKVTTTSSGAAPFAINGRGKVANLNADRVDGLDASALRTRSYVWHSSFTDRTEVTFLLPIPAGSYLVSYSSYFAGLGISSLECAVGESNPSSPERFTARSAMNNGGTTFVPALTGAGLATKRAGGTVSVTCATNGHLFSTAATSPFEIVATPTTTVSASTLAPVSLVQ